MVDINEFLIWTLVLSKQSSTYPAEGLAISPQNKAAVLTDAQPLEIGRHLDKLK